MGSMTIHARVGNKKSAGTLSYLHPHNPNDHRSGTRDAEGGSGGCTDVSDSRLAAGNTLSTVV